MFALALAAAIALSAGPKAAGPKKTQLKIEAKPEAAVVYLDGKRLGTGAKPHTITVTPGRHFVRIVHNKDEHQDMVSVKSGEMKSWSWAFEDDRPKPPPPPPEAAPEPPKEGQGEGEKAESPATPAEPERAWEKGKPADDSDEAAKPVKKKKRKPGDQTNPLDDF